MPFRSHQLSKADKDKEDLADMALYPPLRRIFLVRFSRLLGQKQRGKTDAQGVKKFAGHE